MNQEDMHNEGKSPQKSVTLKVEEARQRDVGRSIVRLDAQTMQTLALHTGDIVEIAGKRISAGIAWPAYPQDQDLHIVRLDSHIRHNVGVEPQDTVAIRKANVEVAKTVLLSPAPLKVNTDSRFDDFVKRKLLNNPIVLNDEISITIGINREVGLKVTALEPEGICIVKASTVLCIHENPKKDAESP